MVWQGALTFVWILEAIIRDGDLSAIFSAVLTEKSKHIRKALENVEDNV